MGRDSANKAIRNYIRFSLLLLILPVLYLGLWFSISGNESLTYFEQVQQLMSFFPEGIRNPYGLNLAFFAMSLGAGILAFLGYLKSIDKKAQVSSIILCLVATLLTTWFGMSLL